MNQDLKQYAQLHDENIELKKEIERLKGEIDVIHEQYKGMGLDILCLLKMIGDRKLSSTEKVVLENIKQSQRTRLHLLKKLPEPLKQ